MLSLDSERGKRMRQELNFIHNVKKEMLILVDSGWWEHKVCYIYEYFFTFLKFCFFSSSFIEI